jgi:hypothetical protein
MAGETRESKVPKEKKAKPPEAEGKKSKASAKGADAPDAAGKKAKAAEAAPAEAPAKAAQVHHAPADPRVRVLNKLRAKMLPKGELRARLKALLDRWNSGPDHGGVTVAELQDLLDAWKKAKGSTGL